MYLKSVDTLDVRFCNGMKQEHFKPFNKVVYTPNSI